MRFLCHRGGHFVRLTDQGAIIMTNKTLCAADLMQFIGSEQWYRHGLVRKVLFTEGVKYVADTAGAYWLIDEVALAQQFNKRVAREEFQTWKLTVKANHHATLTCEDGNGNAVWSKAIEFTDFPLDDFTLFYTDNVILLPSEY